MLRKPLHVTAIALTLTFGAGFALYAHDDTQPNADAQAKAAPADNNAKPDSDTAKLKGKPKNAGTVQPSQAGSDDTGQPASPPAATAAGDAPKVSTEAEAPKKIVWPFNGMTGYVDKQAAQRGFQIYSQVCSACHSMNLVAYRNLGDIGFSEGEVKALAAQKQVSDMNDAGEPVQRPGKPFDHFIPPFANEKASRAANNGAYPPDLSLIVKAREYGPDYVYSILTGFGNPPANEPAVANKYYNSYFQGHWISMPPPLHDGAVSYEDGTNANVDQMARDVVTFLEWAAEPEMESRHEMGLKVLVFLLITAIVFYVAKKRVWKNLKH